MKRMFQVLTGPCASCGQEKGPQPVARYSNGLSLCETHQRRVTSQHTSFIKDHPLLAEKSKAERTRDE